MTEQRKAKIDVGDILPLALTLVVAGMGIAFGLNIIADLKDDTLCGTGNTYNATADRCENSSSVDTGGTAAFNATKDTITGVAKFSSKMSIIATVIVAAIVIGLLVRFLAGSGN